MAGNGHSEGWSDALISSLSTDGDLESAECSRQEGATLVRLTFRQPRFKESLSKLKVELERAEVDSFEDLFIYQGTVSAELIMRFYSSRAAGREVRVSLGVAAGEVQRLPRASAYWPAARSCENEASELFGIQFEGAAPAAVGFSVGTGGVESDKLGGDGVRA